MSDPYLEAMMKGQLLSKKLVQEKDKFEIAIEQEINQYIAAQSLENDFIKNELNSPTMQKAKLIAEIKAGIDLSELEQHIEIAQNILLSEGHQHLDETTAHEIIESISSIPEVIEDADLSTFETDDFQHIFKISDKVMQGILEIGIKKYKIEDYASSISIFALLTTLAPGNSDYWFRLGIAAQKNENTSLALRAYDATIDIEPTLIGAHLFSVECHLQNEDLDKAKQSLQKAKTLIEEEPRIDQEWRELLIKIENTISEITAD